MHNAEFDRKFLPDWMRAFPWICTYRCALHLVPDARSHKNGSLWYELGLLHPMPKEAGNMPHRALFDALMTFDLLEWMLDFVKTDQSDGIWNDDASLSPIEVLVKLSTAPAVLTTCRFGKHAGKCWEDVDSGYMEWALRQDFDEDVKHTCRHWLTERGVPLL